MGRVFLENGQVDITLELFRFSVAIKEREALGSLSLATSLYFMGWEVSVRDQGKLDEALDCYDRALEIFERDARGSLTVANMFNNIGSDIDREESTGWGT